MKNRLLIIVVIVILMIIAIVLSLFNRKPDLPWEATPIQQEEVNVQSATAERKFPTHPAEPLLLYENRLLNKSIYVKDGAIYSHSTKDSEDVESILLDIEADEGFYWRNGSTLLLGIPIEQTNPDSSLHGEWHAIHIGETEAIQPSIVKLEDAFIDPRKLLKVTIAEEEGHFLLIVDNDNVRFNEYFYTAGTSRLQYVNIHIPRDNPDYYEEHYLSKRPQATVDVQYFQKATPYPLSDGSAIHGYEDELGTLLVYRSDADHRVVPLRYASLTLVDVALKQDVLGNNHPIIWTDGSFPSMSYPVIGNSTSLQPTEELLDEEWRMVTMRQFYRLDGNVVRTIQFETYEQGGYYSNPKHRMYELPSMPDDDYNGLLTLKMNGVVRYLSVFDLLNGNGVLDELWMENLPVTLTSTIGERAKEHWELLNESALPAELVDHLWAGVEIPNEVSEADSECIVLPHCGGDFYSIPQIRSIEGVWYLLQGTDFYQVKDHKLLLLGQMPVTTAYTHGEGSNGYTASDYIHIGSDWYVADTYGDRVIKLDANLTMIAEYPLPTPSQIIMNNNKLHVNSLQGITVLDEHLKWISDSQHIPGKVKSAQPTEHLLSEVTHHIDKKHGTHWAYVSGTLIIYNPSNKQYETKFMGYPQSGRAVIRVFPYNDEVIVLMDYRLLRFSPDGKWKNTIDFTRSADDGTYDKTPTGENSYVLDATSGHIYIVQGVRIMDIDLNSSLASTIFQQNYSEIGNLSLYKDRLVFTMEGNPYYSPDESTEHSNELVVIHTKSGAITRYPLESGWFSERLDEQQPDQLQLWSFQDPYNRAWEQIYRGTLPLEPLSSEL